MAIIDYNIDLHWKIPEVLSQSECETFINLAHKIGFQKSTINHSTKGVIMDTNARNNERVVHDDPKIASDLFDKLKIHLPISMNSKQLVGLNERIRFYKYSPGEFFARHRDEILELKDGRTSYLTLLIYLNDDFKGGNTLIEGPYANPDKEIIQPQSGMAFLMQHSLIHEGETLTSGTKYILRSDVMYR